VNADMNQHKTFAFIFSLGGNKLEWSGDGIKALLERATSHERENLRNWMERCKPGRFLILSGGCALCTGMEENLPTLVNVDDDGHGVTRKSKEVFLENRHLVYPIQQVTIIWNGEMVSTDTQVQGADGSIISLSGFGIGYNGEGFSGMIWLLEQCGIDYDKEMLSRMDMHSPGSLTLYPLEQNASKIWLWAWGKQWEAKVIVERSNGEPLILHYPPDQGMLYDDLPELIDLIIYDCQIRGIDWTADPRLVYNSEQTEIPSDWDEVRAQQSERIEWNYGA